MRWKLQTGIAVLVGILISLSFVGAPAQADSFTAPDYPSADCTPVSGATQLGLAPQQWNSSVGIPLTPSGTPAAQRIVIGELDVVPNMTAVNLLLTQCDLPTVTVINHTNRASSGAGANVIDLEPTLDVAVAAAALPQNASMIVVNSPNSKGWYGLFVNMAEACGLVFDGDPFTAVRNLAKGPDYPAGGCIISVSWGGPEPLQGDVSGADAVIGMMADLGVVMLVSAGDEGSGGCLTSSGGLMGDGTLVGVNAYEITSNIATLTTDTAHGFTAGQDVFLGAMPNANWDGMYRILGTTTTTFTVGLSASNVTPTAITAKASVDFGGLVPQYPAINPNILAVGGTQWDAQSTSLADGVNIPYVVGAASSNYVWWDSFANGNCANLPNYPTSGGQGTGGGQSDTYAMPSYQTAAATANYPALPARRMMPDIAALAGWPTYGIANPGVSIEAAELLSNTAILLVSSTTGFELGETITVADLPAPFTSFNGTHTITGGSTRVLNFALTGADIAPGKVAAGSVSQSCTPGGDGKCVNAQFPWYPVFGTSAATPLSAMGIANVNAVLSARGLPIITNDGSSMDIHNLVYSSANSSAFADVTSGSNDIHSLGGYNAMTGFDMVTGMGVPNFSTLADLLVARLTPSSGGGSSSSTATTPEAGAPVVIPPVVVAPEPVVPVIAPSALRDLGRGVTISTGVNTATTPRVIVTEPASRTRADAPRVPLPIKRWRVPVLDVPGAAREFEVQMRVGRSWRSLGEVTSNRRGKVALPAVRMTRVGKYPVRLTDEQGRSYYVVLRAQR